MSTKIEKILDVLQAGTETTSDLLDVFLSGYDESYRKLRQLTRGAQRRQTRRWADNYKEQKQFYVMLSKLKKQGFLDKTRHRRGGWQITKSGTEKLKSLKAKSKFSLKNISYLKKPDNKLRIVIFDIPEKERQKRFWLRGGLIALGFSKLQQSVWQGRFKISESFIRDLKDKGITDYVHIFEVGQTGTLREVS